MPWSVGTSRARSVERVHVRSLGAWWHPHLPRIALGPQDLAGLQAAVPDHAADGAARHAEQAGRLGQRGGLESFTVAS